MQRCYSLITFILLFILQGFSQDEPCNCPGGSKKTNGVLYASWGYNRNWFSKSDLHFKDQGSDNYDFTLYDVEATDRPDFNKILRTIELSVPQYVYRIGYYFSSKQDMGVEINFDHSKYVMINDQVVHVKGQIHGIELDQDTLLHGNFLKFEHTNGANFLMANFIKRKDFLHSSNNKHWLSAVLKAGAGIVIPKTDVSLFGNRLDNRFHIAGWIAGIETGFRYDFSHFFAEATAKGAFANYSNVLVIGTGKASHRFWCTQAILTAGFQFGL